MKADWAKVSTKLHLENNNNIHKSVKKQGVKFPLSFLLKRLIKWTQDRF